VHELHRPVLAWYEANRRDLPWREPGCSPWLVLVSEIMLQQTPVARVLPVWHEWAQRWPRPSDLAAAPAGEAIRAWGRLGYPRRALRLHQAATAIADHHGDQVPDDHAQLLTLPGVGSYTAAAVAAFAYRQRHAVLDTNVRRVLARAVIGKAQAAAATTVEETRLAAGLLPGDPETAATWSVAVMELGALVCTARTARCGECPLHRQCAWRRAGSPPDTGPARRAQPWAGTDRQVRGRIMAELRGQEKPVSRSALQVAIPDPSLRDPGQRDRCLAGLIDDGLIEPLPRDRFALPG
jgi:A/G-specific adenine glycosylase